MILFSVLLELCYTLYTGTVYISNLMLDLGILSRGQIYKASQTSDLLGNRTITSYHISVFWQFWIMT